MRRSARRQTVRARCSAAAAGVPPGRMKRRSGGSSASSLSIQPSRRATSSRPDGDLRHARGDALAPGRRAARRARTDRAGSAAQHRRRGPASTPLARATPSRRSARRPRRRRRRAGPTCGRGCRRTASSRRRRRFVCRSSRWLNYKCQTEFGTSTRGRRRAAAKADRTGRGRPPAAARLPRRAADASAATCSRWYRRNGRDLPWRKTDDPYHILVSEIMLQQTQVDRVLPKYHEWLGKYPSLAALADAPRGGGRQDVVSARLQHPAAAAAVDRARGGGAVTAASCRPTKRRCCRSRASAPTPPARSDSFAFRERAAILDTNVARVLFRVVRRPRRPEEARDEEAPLGGLGAWCRTSACSTSTRR